jgi:vacuolar protein sorting-associated protein 54
MLRDVEFFQSRLGKIDGFEDAGEYLVNIIKNKRVLALPPAPAPEPEPEPAPSPPPAAATPPPPAESPTEAQEGKKSAEEQQPAEPQATEAAAEVEKNGGSDDASKA